MAETSPSIQGARAPSLLAALLFVSSGFIFAAASLLSDPSILPGVLLRGQLGLLSTFAAALLLVYAVSCTERLGRGLFLWGLSFHLAAFYWLSTTLMLFGGFPAAASTGLLFLYAVVSSIQFLVCVWVYRRLRNSIPEQLGISFALAWAVCDFLVPRLFPWSFIHPLISWPGFALLASYLGEAPLCFLFLWGAELAAGVLRGRRRFAAIGVYAVSVSVLAVLSTARRTELEAELPAARKLRVALVQGNLSTSDKGDVRMLSANIERYRALSLEAVSRGAELVVWPESVMNVWTPEQMASVRGTKYDPFPDNGVPLLYGGLSFRPRPKEEVERLSAGLGAEVRESFSYKKFNSAFGIDRDGIISGRYHKRVLMAFGEYLPLTETFPSIKSISPHSGDFTPGDLLEPISFAHGDSSFKIGALICYEDLVPSLSREAVNRGADLLVNLTNDAWYGETAAPYQHHLLASWRAIESGRFLLRATNTGVTAVVDPYGQTTVALPIFSEATAEVEIGLLQGETVYARIGDTASWIMSAAAAIFVIAGMRKRLFI